MKAPEGFDERELMAGNLRGLREYYATGFITFEELEIGLDSVLSGGAINVPTIEDHAARGCEKCITELSR